MTLSYGLTGGDTLLPKESGFVRNACIDRHYFRTKKSMRPLQWGRNLGSCGNLGLRAEKAALFVALTALFSLQWGRSLGSCGNRPRFSHCRNSQLRALLREPTFRALAKLN
jgi:hypothetical protein